MNDNHSRRKAQCALVLDALQAGRRLTPRDAQDEFNCWRLAAVIHTLRREGHPVVTEMVGDDGKQYAEYHLTPPGGGQLQLADFGKPNVAY